MTYPQKTARTEWERCSGVLGGGRRQMKMESEGAGEKVRADADLAGRRREQLAPGVAAGGTSV